MALRPAPSLLMKHFGFEARGEHAVDVAARATAFVRGVVPVDGVAVEPWAIDAALGGCHRPPADAAAWMEAGERATYSHARATASGGDPSAARGNPGGAR